MQVTDPVPVPAIAIVSARWARLIVAVTVVPALIAVTVHSLPEVDEQPAQLAKAECESGIALIVIVVPSG